MATHVFIDTSAQPTAAAWYRTVRAEPYGSDEQLLIDPQNVHEIASMTLEALLDQILATRPSEVVTVSHGSPSGFSFQVSADSQQVANTETLDRIRDSDQFSDATLGNDLGFRPEPERRAAELRQKMRDVQRLTLTTIQLRACHVGDTGAPLASIFQFFGCDGSVGGPITRDIFMPVTPFNARTAEQLRAVRPQGIVREFPGVLLMIVPGTLAFQLFALADLQVRRDWMISTFARHNAFQPGPHDECLRRCPVHGLLLQSSSQFVLPGEAGYLSNIVSTCNVSTISRGVLTP